jgi:hypothetical protein
MTVAAGGTLTLGTAGSPIPSSVKATLLLSSGTYAGQYRLTVQSGGNFLVYGAAKTPATTVSSGDVGPGTTGIPFDVADATGWQVGDVIVIDTEAVTVSGLTSNQITGVTPGLALKH